MGKALLPVSCSIWKDLETKIKKDKLICHVSEQCLLGLRKGSLGVPESASSV